MHFLPNVSPHFYTGKLKLAHRLEKVKNAVGGGRAYLQGTEFLCFVSQVSSYVFLISDSSTYAMYVCIYYILIYRCSALNLAG